MALRRNFKKATTVGRTAALFATGVAMTAPLFAYARPAAWMQAAPSASNAVLDEVGRRVEIPAKVNRIVSLSPDLTETIYALGLDGQARGRYEFLRYTGSGETEAAHRRSAKIPSIEAIVALHPGSRAGNHVDQPRGNGGRIEAAGYTRFTPATPHTVRGMLNSTGARGGCDGKRARKEPELVGRLKRVSMRSG